jgi:predicted esterase
VEKCGWLSNQIHLFGFGQGGSVAAELALKYWRKSQETQSLASVVTVCGPLLSYPTAVSCPTPILIVHRPGRSESQLTPADLTAFSKGFTGRVVVEKLPSTRDGMPASKDEWFPVMKFWADVLSRRISGEGIYRIN